MAISYSLSKKRMTFGKESGKLYATAQHNGVVSGMEFAKRVSRRAAKPPATVVQYLLSGGNFALLRKPPATKMCSTYRHKTAGLAVRCIEPRGAA